MLLCIFKILHVLCISVFQSPSDSHRGNTYNHDSSTNNNWNTSSIDAVFFTIVLFVKLILWQSALYILLTEQCVFDSHIIAMENAYNLSACVFCRYCMFSHRNMVRLTLTVTLSNITRHWLETSQSGYQIPLTVLFFHQSCRVHTFCSGQSVSDSAIMTVTILAMQTFIIIAYTVVALRTITV